MGERNSLGVGAEGDVCPFLLHPVSCAPVWIHSSVSNVNLSKPFKILTLVLDEEEEKSDPPDCSV